MSSQDVGEVLSITGILISLPIILYLTKLSFWEHLQWSCEAKKQYLKFLIYCLLSGFSLMVYQLFVYPFITRLSSPLVSARVAAVCIWFISTNYQINMYSIFYISEMLYICLQIITIPLVTTFPFMTYLSGFVLSFVVTCASVLRNVFSVSI